MGVRQGCAPFHGKGVWRGGPDAVLDLGLSPPSCSGAALLLCLVLRGQLTVDVIAYISDYGLSS